VKNLTWQNPEQLFVAQELINKVKSKCCGIKDVVVGLANRNSSVMKHFYMKTLLLSLLLCMGSSAWGDTVTDVLNQTFTGITGTSYSEFSGKKATSGAVYAGQCAGGNSSIQLRSSNSNSGVVTTTSGGKAKSITVEWNSSTTNGRTLNVYGSSTAYSAASDLYNSSKQGTLLGTIVYGTSTSLTISNDYEYIGFRSASGALYLASVSINWGVSSSDQVNTPSFSITEGAFVSSKSITISCATEDASIYYTTDGSEPNIGSTLYTEPFSISATTTVKAVATKEGMEDSDVATQTFTKETILDGINALNEAATTTSTDYYVNLTNAQITFTGTESNKPIAYLNDENAGIYIYNVSQTLNTLYNGVWKISAKKYSNLPEITAITEVEGEGTSEMAASDMAPVELSTSTLDANFTDNLGRQIKIVGFNVTDAAKLTDNIGIYTTAPYLGSALTVDKSYTLVGYPYINSSTKTFRVVSAEEITLKDNAISGLNDTYTLDLVADEGISSYTFLATATSGAEVSYEIVSTDIDNSDIDLTSNELTVSALGTTTIRAYVNSDGEYMPAEKVFTVYAKGNPTIVVSNDNVVYGSTFTVDESTIEGGDITVTSGNTAIATIDGLVITPVAVGSVVITVATAETNVYNAGSETFTLTVDAPDVATTTPSLKTLLAEFDFTSNTWGLPDGSDKKTTEKNSYTADGKTITLEGGTGNGYYYATDNYLLMGKEGATMTFTAFDKSVTQIDIVGRTGASGSVKQNIYVGDETVSTETTGATGTNEYAIAEGYQDAGTIYTLKVTSKHNTQITAIKVYTLTTITAKLNASGYATYCSQYPLDFSNAEGYTAWMVTDTSDDAITFEKITGKIKGGQGVLLMGEANQTITLSSADSENNLEDNLMEGTLAPTYVTTVNGDYTNFGLSGDAFVKINDGTIPAGKAYLPVETSNLPTGGDARMRLVFMDETTGIEAIEATTVENDVIYNLSGQRVVNPAKGIFIKNGKKFIVR